MEEEDSLIIENSRLSENDGGVNWLKKLKSPTPKKLSIQSGDIIRSPTPVSPPTSPTPELEAVSSPMGSESPRSPSDWSVARKQGFVFFIIYSMVDFFFFSVKFRKSPKAIIPVGSLVIIVLNQLFIGAIIALAFMKFPPQINISTKSFGIPSHPAQINWDAYTAAKKQQFSNDSLSYNTPIDISKRSIRQKRSNFRLPNCDPSSYTQYALHTNWEMDLVFRVPPSNPDKNILTRERISYIHSIENAIYNSTKYKHFCHKRSSTNLCDPLNSLLTWLYPRDKKTGKYIYNTTDGFTQDLPGTLKSLSSDLSVALWFTGGEINFVNSSYIEAKLLRSQVRVGLPLPCFSSINDRRNVQKEWVTEYFISLVPMLEEMSNSEVEVLYGGPNVFDYQVKAAIIHDAYKAILSFSLIIALMFILSGFSVWLTFFGMYSIVTCFPPAYFVYRVCFNIETIGLLNIVSVFVIIGIGVDDVFVFINTFKQSSRLPNLVSPYHRLTYTIIEAGKATFFTSLTTSVAFYANAISLIPAVRQFGIFMGLVVISCYIQVFVIVPHALYIWDCYFKHIENFFYHPLVKLIGILHNRIRRCRTNNSYDNVPSVIAMTTISHDNDSGIETSSLSHSDSTSNDSNQAHSDDVSEESMEQKDDDVILLDPEVISTTITTTTTTVDDKLTTLMQTAMFGIAIIPMTSHLLIRKLIEKIRSCKWPLLSVHACIAALAYLVLIGISIGMFSNMQLTDKPPQLFNPDTNIQKMLDLAGNVTDSSAINCYNCSAWNSNNYIPTSGGGNNGGGGGTNSGGGGTTTTIPTAKTTTQTPPSHHTSSTAPTTTTATSTGGTTPPPTPRTTSTTHSTPKPPTSTVATAHTPTTTPPNSGGVTTPTTPNDNNNGGVVTTATPAPGDQGGNHISSSRFSSNVIVFAVFGVKSVERDYNPSHVLPENDDKLYAVLDNSFSSLLACPIDPTRTNEIRGTLRALCRICANISNIDNKLALEGNFQCFPSSATGLTCLMPLLTQLPECAFLSKPDYSKISVSAGGLLKRDSQKGVTHLQYLAMAFKSTTNLGDSPTEAIQGYHKWEDFLASELQAIKADSSEGGLYEGASVLLTGFQTSDQWVQVNVIAIAVNGSFYGIIISFILCSIVVVILSHDFRIIFAMVMTIGAILFSLLAFFWMFGWRLGIVEAISLSILVGNSLDYCIHLSEGYVATDARHMAFVEKFTITKGAPLRVKRVMSAISFIGVSIFSSAITTILAIIPLLWTQIHLFTRFGEILLLDTAMAIVYTIFICGNCLAFFGPSKAESVTKRVINGLVTISATVAVYLLLFLCLFIASRFGVYIPSPQGGTLF